MSPSKFAKFTCDICQKTLRRKQTFEAHMKTHLPPEEKPFKCEVCDKSFGSQAWLTRHGKVHSGVRHGQLENSGNGQEAPHFSGTYQQNQKHSDERGYEAGVVDPFILLPREIWCMVLDNFSQSIDILNLFKVYPGLEVLYMRKRQLYLFDQVTRHIARWVTIQDLLNCRAVSKQWNSGVDNFLENHPSVRAYNPEADQQLKSKSWSPSRYRRCHGGEYTGRGRPEQGYVNYFDEKYWFGTDNIRKFMVKMEGCPAEINPFVGRYISMDLTNRGYWYESELEEFLERILGLLLIWGRHIWFLKINVRNDEFSVHLYDFIVKSLAYLPNLKSLHMHMSLQGLKIKYGHRHMPDLPCLETLHISGTSFADSPTRMLLPQYSTQLRRVHLQLTESDLTDAERQRYSMSLPNLTELEIIDIFIGKEGKWKTGVNNILLSIVAPRLFNLCLEFDQGYFNIVEQDYLDESDMFHWLHRFPSLTNFYFEQLQQGLRFLIRRHALHSLPPVPSKGTRSRGNFICSSVESICLHRSTLAHYPEILYCFPSLKRLQICDMYACKANPSKNEEQCFRECNKTLFIERFWKVLKNHPKLNVIICTRSKAWLGRRYYFSKAAVEKYLHNLAEEDHRIRYILEKSE